ncbi:hypothetical protein [Arthrobacter sp. BE255]|uniref:hypothetical protein n=1 Tax=Arthrobacter sp. BE255 TaxID=2817721 RepID=UPI0028582F4E|nr:hypothetical protein [Arthrobacter sp. BE255]MDR7160113.1 hypothetical protein [Arthrobacter sp. BE255]
MTVLNLLVIVTFGTLCLVPLWFRPKLLVASALLCVLFVRTLTHLSGIEPLANLDDALVLLTVLRALVQRLSPGSQAVSAGFPGSIAFLGFASLGFLSALLRQPLDPTVVISGSFLATKAILFGWAVAQFQWQPKDVRKMARSAAFVVTIILGATAINAIIPGTWSSVFSVNGAPIVRYGLPSMIGPFIHPFDLAFAMSMSAIAIMSYRRYVGKSHFSAVLLAGSSIATFLSFRRKDLLGLLASTVILAQRFRWNGVLLGGFLCLPLAVVLAWPEITNQFQTINDAYFSAESSEARTVLSLGALQLANEYFPFGAGFGRYASRTAAIEYSPEYFRLGFNAVYGLGPGVGQGAFLTDTSWPAILGESGIFGTACFAFGLVLIFSRAISWERRGVTNEMKWIGATTIGWLILTLFQSTGAAVFTSPPMFAFFLGIVGLGTALQKYELENEEFISKNFVRVRKIIK